MKDDDTGKLLKSNSISHIPDYWNFSFEELRYLNYMKRKTVNFDENMTYCKLVVNDKFNLKNNFHNSFISSSFNLNEKNNLINWNPQTDSTFACMNRKTFIDTNFNNNSNYNFSNLVSTGTANNSNPFLKQSGSAPMPLSAGNNLQNTNQNLQSNYSGFNRPISSFNISSTNHNLNPQFQNSSISRINPYTNTNQQGGINLTQNNQNNFNPFHNNGINNSGIRTPSYINTSQINNPIQVQNNIPNYQLTLHQQYPMSQQYNSLNQMNNVYQHSFTDYSAQIQNQPNGLDAQSILNSAYNHFKENRDSDLLFKKDLITGSENIKNEILRQTIQSHLKEPVVSTRNKPKKVYPSDYAYDGGVNIYNNKFYKPCSRPIFRPTFNENTTQRTNSLLSETNSNQSRLISQFKRLCDNQNSNIISVSSSDRSKISSPKSRQSNAISHRILRERKFDDYTPNYSERKISKDNSVISEKSNVYEANYELKLYFNKPIFFKIDLKCTENRVYIPILSKKLIKEINKLKGLSDLDLIEEYITYQFEEDVVILGSDDISILLDKLKTNIQENGSKSKNIRRVKCTFTLKSGIIEKINKELEDPNSVISLEYMKTEPQKTFFPKLTNGNITNPPFEKLLLMTQAELKDIKDFKISNIHGEVEFKDSLDLCNVNLDIIEISKGKFEILETCLESFKKLNVSATIKLLNIFQLIEEENSEDDFMVNLNYFHEICEKNKVI